MERRKEAVVRVKEYLWKKSEEFIGDETGAPRRCVKDEIGRRVEGGDGVSVKCESKEDGCLGVSAVVAWILSAVLGRGGA